MEKPDGQEADGRRISPRPRAAKEDWWSLPTPNRRAVAYHLGRLLNQLRWHFQRSLLSVSEKDDVLKADEVSIWDEKMANAVLDRILAVSCRLANEPGTSMETTIRRVRREWVDEVFSEDVADEITDFSDEKDERGQYSRVNGATVGGANNRQHSESCPSTLRFTRNLVAPFGRGIDQSIRRPDAYRFMYRIEMPDLADLSEVMEIGGDNCDESHRVLVNYLPQPGSLPMDDSWVQEIHELCAKGGAYRSKMRLGFDKS